MKDLTAQPYFGVMLTGVARRGFFWTFIPSQ